MSQNWTDDLYENSYEADTTLKNMENNFACLKSCFSGSSAPSNPVAGMLWLDTSTHILKQRNEANNAWVNILDIANGWTVFAASMIADAVRKASLISGEAISPASCSIKYTHPGAQVCTLNDDTVTPGKMADGALPIVSVPGGSGSDAGPCESIKEAVGVSWTDMLQHYVYIPTGATTLKGRARIKRTQGAGGVKVYFRFLVGANVSSEASGDYISYTWTSEVSLSMFSTGWQLLKVQMKTDTTGYGKVDGYTIGWH